MTLRRPIGAAILAIAAVSATGAPTRAADTKRFGIEGKLLDYDEARSVFKIKVVQPKVSGGFGMGGVAGKPPSGIAKGDELEFAVVPEGSVLSRTVIKGSKGGGLDNTGTKDGFKRAVAVIPRDREVVLSFEDNPKKGDDVPKYILKMVQIRLTPEEIAERLREMGVDQKDIDEATQDAGE